MPMQAMTLVADQTTGLTGTGTLPRSVRYVDLRDVQYVRLTSVGSVTAGTGIIALGLEYSTDDGANWGQMISQGPNWTSGGNQYPNSAWTEIPDDAATDDVLVRVDYTAGASTTFRIMSAILQYR